MKSQFFYDDLDLTARKLEDGEHTWYFRSAIELVRWLPVFSTHEGVEVLKSFDKTTKDPIHVFSFDADQVGLVGYSHYPWASDSKMRIANDWGVHVRGGSDFHSDQHPGHRGRRFTAMLIVAYDKDVHNLKEEIERLHPHMREAEL